MTRREFIINYLDVHGPKTGIQINEALNYARGGWEVSRLLRRMTDAGTLDRTKVDRGWLYRLVQP